MLEGGAVDISHIEPVHSPEKKKFPFCKASDLAVNITPYNWLINNFLERDSLALFFGDPGCGKSFVSLDVSAHVACGKNWHDKQATQGGVFYIAGEGHNGIGKRLKAWEIENDTSLVDAPLYISEQAASFYDQHSAQAVCESVESLAKEFSVEPALIVIDTLARNFGAANENSTEDTNQFISHIDQYLRAPFKACVLIIHHTGHGEKGRARGSMALKGALDAEYQISQTADKIITVSCTKMKDAKEPKPASFSLNSVELPVIDDEGDAVTSAALKQIDWQPSDGKVKKRLSGRNEAIFNSLSRAIEAHGVKPSADIKERFAGFNKFTNKKVVLVDHWRKEAYPVIDVDSQGDESEAKKKAFKRGTEALRKHHVQTMNDYWWSTHE